MMLFPPQAQEEIIPNTGFPIWNQSGGIPVFGSESGKYTGDIQVRMVVYWTTPADNSIMSVDTAVCWPAVHIPLIDKWQIPVGSGLVLYIPEMLWDSNGSTGLLHSYRIQYCTVVLPSSRKHQTAKKTSAFDILLVADRFNNAWLRFQFYLNHQSLGQILRYDWLNHQKSRWCTWVTRHSCLRTSVF
jgi:hypothetical protein